MSLLLSLLLRLFPMGALLDSPSSRSYPLSISTSSTDPLVSATFVSFYSLPAFGSLNSRGSLVLSLDLMRLFGQWFARHHPLHLLETHLFPPPPPSASTLQPLSLHTTALTLGSSLSLRSSSSSSSLTSDLSDSLPPLLNDPIHLIATQRLLVHIRNHTQTLHQDAPYYPASSTSSHDSEASESMPALVDYVDDNLSESEVLITDDFLSTADLLTILFISLKLTSSLLFHLRPPLFNFPLTPLHLPLAPL